MKLTFPHARLKAVWDEAVRQWPASKRAMNARTPRGFWLVGGQGICLMHNGARPKGSATVAYPNECDPAKVPSENLLGVKRAIFGDSDGKEFIEAIVIGTAVDGGCDIEIAFEHDAMMVTVIERGRSSLQWQTLRTRHTKERCEF